jgi:hypothetical protein
MCSNIILSKPTKFGWSANLGDVPVCNICYDYGNNAYDRHTREVLLAMNNNIFLYNAVISHGNLSFTLKAIKALTETTQLIFPKWFDFKVVEVKPLEKEIVRLYKEAKHAT